MIDLGNEKAKFKWLDFLRKVTSFDVIHPCFFVYHVDASLPMWQVSKSLGSSKDKWSRYETIGRYFRSK